MSVNYFTIYKGFLIAPMWTKQVSAWVRNGPYTTLPLRSYTMQRVAQIISIDFDGLKRDVPTYSSRKILISGIWSWRTKKIICSFSKYPSTSTASGEANGKERKLQNCDYWRYWIIWRKADKIRVRGSWRPTDLLHPPTSHDFNDQDLWRQNRILDSIMWFATWKIWRSSAICWSSSAQYYWCRAHWNRWNPWV